MINLGFWGVAIRMALRTWSLLNSWIEAKASVERAIAKSLRAEAGIRRQVHREMLQRLEEVNRRGVRSSPAHAKISTRLRKRMRRRP